MFIGEMSRKLNINIISQVSVIITAYNSEAYLEDAILSVLTQDFKDFDIVVVDDGSSTDASRKIVERLCRKYNQDIRYLYQENKGPSAARNKGIRESNSEYIAFLDSDDIYEPYKLSLQLKILKSLSDEYAFVCGGAKLFYDAQPFKIKYRVPSIVDGNIYRELVEDKVCIQGTPGFLFRRTALEKIGGYDENLRNNEDFDLIIRSAHQYKARTHQEIVYRERKRLDSLSNFNPENNLKYSIEFIDKLHKLEPDLPKKLVDRKRQRACFSTAIQFFEQGNYNKFRQFVKQGVQLYGQPVTLKGWVALFIAYTGVCGKAICNLNSIFKKHKSMSNNY
jgi:glycosyltransferase involved in cell wall biosynthesis